MDGSGGTVTTCHGLYRDVYCGTIVEINSRIGIMSMNSEEIVAERYLRSIQTGNIRYEPDGNVPPDFSIGNTVAVEVRRLNQNILDKEKAVGLENFAFPIWQVFVEVLKSFDRSSTSSTFFVGLEFQRTPDASFKDIKHRISSGLSDFLTDQRKVPCEIAVTEDINLSIRDASFTRGVQFKPAGSIDMDWGGSVIEIYVNNLELSIGQKSKKVEAYLQNYPVWWLILVDYLAADFVERQEEIAIKDRVNDLGCFDRVLIVHGNGKDIVLEFER